MTTIIPFPRSAVARLATTPRMTQGDLETLRQRWPSGHHTVTVTDDRVAYDVWTIPSAGADAVPVLLVTLQPNGDWTLHDAEGRLIKTDAPVASI